MLWLLLREKTDVVYFTDRLDYARETSEVVRREQWGNLIVDSAYWLGSSLSRCDASFFTADTPPPLNRIGILRGRARRDFARQLHTGSAREEAALGLSEIADRTGRGGFSSRESSRSLALSPRSAPLCAYTRAVRWCARVSIRHAVIFGRPTKIKGIKKEHGDAATVVIAEKTRGKARTRGREGGGGGGRAPGTIPPGSSRYSRGG